MLKFYKAGARSRGLAWELTDEQFYAITAQPCHYCGVPPSRESKTIRGGRFVYNGVDRIKNSDGYTAGNVLPCCYECNYAKHTMDYPEFTAWMRRLIGHQVLLTDTVR